MAKMLLVTSAAVIWLVTQRCVTTQITAAEEYYIYNDARTHVMAHDTYINNRKVMESVGSSIIVVRPNVSYKNNSVFYSGRHQAGVMSSGIAKYQKYISKLVF